MERGAGRGAPQTEGLHQAQQGVPGRLPGVPGVPGMLPGVPGMGAALTAEPVVTPSQSAGLLARVVMATLPTWLN